MAMTNQDREELTRHLLDAIEQVRTDVARVEMWASALDGFSRPVPEYDLDEGRVWLPREQGGDLQ
jgi:hypothetical protein